MSKLYMQFSNCIPVKGFSRSALYDLQRVRHIFTPNEFVDFLFFNRYKISDKDIDFNTQSYIEYLVQDGWGRYVNELVADLFPPLKLDWDNYATITNAQIDINNNQSNISLFFSKVLPELEQQSCKYYQINFMESVDFKALMSFLSFFDDTQVSCLNLMLPYFNLSYDESLMLFEKQPRLNFIHFYLTSNPSAELMKNKKIFFSSHNISVRKESEITPAYFTINVSLFTESQKHNTYYNRKVGIDSDGYIKNSPEHDNNFGNIKDTTLIEAINKKGFKNLWFVHKEMIDVCKDCEFRHMCVDSCLPIERKDGTFFRSKECNYNPYIAKWKGEEDYKTLEECGISINILENKIDSKKLEQFNVEIWGDE